MSTYYSTDILTQPTTEDSPVRVYWDEQDPADCGPAWKSDTDSDRLDHWGWAGCDDDGEGRHISDYFGADGYYLGPDADGVYPVLA